MEIKYGADGQPLPESQQDWAKNPPSDTPTTGQQANTKEFKVQESPEDGDVSEVQLHNPFVAEYIKNKQIEKEQVEQQAFAPAEPEQQLSEVEPEPEEPAKKPDHPNFKALRQSAERAERERDEALRLLRERDLRDREQQGRTNVTPISDDFDLAEDGYVEPKHVKRVLQETRAVRKELADYKQKTARELQEMMLYKQHPDIDNIVTPENIELLKELKPAYARQLSELYAQERIYEAGDLAYSYLNDLGIIKPKNTPKDYSADKARAHINTTKPKPMVSGTTVKNESPLARANAYAGDLNDADMKRYYAELEAAIKTRNN